MRDGRSLRRDRVQCKRSRLLFKPDRRQAIARQTVFLRRVRYALSARRRVVSEGSGVLWAAKNASVLSIDTLSGNFLLNTRGPVDMKVVMTDALGLRPGGVTAGGRPFRGARPTCTGMECRAVR